MADVEVQTFSIPPSKTTRGQIIVLDGAMSTTVLKFPMNPEGFKDTHGANYADHAIIGRSHPRSQWTNSNNRQLQLKLELDTRNQSLQMANVGVLMRGARGRASPFTTNPGYLRLGPNPPLSVTNLVADGGFGGNSNRLVAICNLLRALTKPRSLSREELTVSEIFAAPPPFLFVWGPYFRIRCIMRTVDIDWKSWTPSLAPTKATVSLTMTEQPVLPVTYQTYLRKGDLRASTDELID